MTDATYTETTPGGVKVWDLAVRVLHWGLAGAFATAYLTGEEIWTVHEVAGFSVAAIVGLRLIWGAVGGGHALFSDFVRGPAAILGYLRDLVSGRPKRYLGHNPAGGFFAVVLLLLAAATAFSGWAQAYQAASAIGPLMHEAHEALANITLGAVVVHIAAAVVMSLAHKENLPRAMVTGRKRS